jgi:hypothetical protein
VNLELWYFLINGQADEQQGLFGNFYAYGEHLGEALDNTFKAAQRGRFNNPNLVEASLLESFDVIEDSDELVAISDSVYMRNTTYSYPLSDPDKEFIPPVGIVKATGEDEHDYDLIAENFVAYAQDENGIFEFELVVAKDNLRQVFFKAIEFLPSVDGFWVYIQSHWNNKEVELWAAPHFTDRQQVLDFLTCHDKNTLENGYVRVVVHSLEGETNLTLDDHKKIQLHTKDETMFQSFIEQVKGLGYEQTKEFYNLEWGFHHWHYRPANSLPRAEFIDMLQTNGFEFIHAWEE